MGECYGELGGGGNQSVTDVAVRRWAAAAKC